jgi:CheY-like chemotaxis protein
MKSINVLLVDDDSLVQNLAHDVLANRGIKLWNAYDTSEAERILERRKIDVILCDVVMTPEDGLTFCNRLRERHDDTPVILMSAQVSPLGMQKELKGSAASYLMKPFGIEQIYQRILEALARTPVTN